MLGLCRPLAIGFAAQRAESWICARGTAARRTMPCRLPDAWYARARRCVTQFWGVALCAARRCSFLHLSAQPDLQRYGNRSANRVFNCFGRDATLQQKGDQYRAIVGVLLEGAVCLAAVQKDFGKLSVAEGAECCSIAATIMLKHADLSAAAIGKAAAAHRCPHSASTERNDSCSARSTTLQRSHAVGSMRLAISVSTQARRAIGSSASSSQQRFP